MNDITGLILTFNEAPNIARTLGQLSWLRRHRDRRQHEHGWHRRRSRPRFPNVRIVKRIFTTHAEQWNFGLEQTGIATEWVLALDADYVLTDALSRELQALQPDPAVSGFAASFDYCIDGRPLRGAAYPPVTVLFRRARGRYEQDGHTQRVRLDGEVRPLAARIQHDDRKSLSHWIAAQARYMALEADKLGGSDRAERGPGGSTAPMDRDRAAGDVFLLLCRSRRDSRRQGRIVLRAAARGVGTDPVVVSAVSAGAMPSWPAVRTGPGGPADGGAARE